MAKALGARYVIAIDFGTTFSGIAIVDLLTNVTNFNFAWEDAIKAESSYCKTPTVLFYPPAQPANAASSADATTAAITTPPSWGWPAIFNGEDGQILRKFKLHLAPPGAANGIEVSKIPEGKTAVGCIADYLRAIKNLAVSKAALDKPADEVIKNTIFCLTVPAIWTDSAYEDMRSAAQMAGLIQGPLAPFGEGSSHDLIFVREPEAASFYVLSSVLDPPQIDEPYVVIDVGGGTTDIAIHAQTAGSTKHLPIIREVSVPEGAVAGGGSVDAAFFAYLSSISPKFAANRWTKKQAFIKLCASWEGLKRVFTGGETADLTLKLPKPFILDDDTDVIAFTPQQMASFYDPTIAKVVDCVQTAVQSTENMNMAGVLVGGFVTSAYVQAQLQNLLVDQGWLSRLILVGDPGIAVVAGAALYASRTDKLVTERRARYTYAIQVLRVPEQGDPEHAQIRQADSTYTRILTTLVRKGDILPVDHECTPAERFSVCNPNQKRLKLVLFTSHAKEIRFPTEKFADPKLNPVFLGELLVHLPTLQGEFEHRDIEVRVKFGTATMEVTAIDRNSNTRQQTTLNLKPPAASS